jgi:signal transduction histidine kinase/HPt (histidine-containing phosphotransfer) domain-containing protein/AmiR/NasT family two-component response regulator
MRLRPSTSMTLALLVGLLALVGQWVGYSVSAGVLEATLRQSEIDKVDTVGRLIEGLIERRGQRAQVVAKLLASHGVVAAAVATDRPERSASLTREFDEAARNGRVQILEATDRNAAVVFRAHDPARYGDATSGWGIDEALAGKGMLVSTRAPESVVIWSIEPLKVGAMVVGTVAAGVALDTPFFDQIKAEMGTRLTLLSRQGVPLSARGATQQNFDTQAMVEAFQKKIPVYRIDPASRQTNAYLPVMVVDEAYVLLVQPDSAVAYRLLEDGKRRSALFALLTLVASVLIGLLALRVALGPLQRLRTRAVQTAVELTGSAITTPGSDEVASVVIVLQTLTDRLAQRNRELVEATAQADAASRAKSQFLSAMSHEIRTPLNGVLGMTELLRSTKLDREQARFVKLIASAGEALHGLLGDILDLAKIEEGQIVLERVDFDLKRTLTDIVGVYGEVASARGLEMLVDLGQSPAMHVSGDPTRLRQVLSNLLGNSIKFTEHGEVALRCEAIEAPAGDARAWWRFTVRDSGIGIAPQAVGKLFQRFVQADASTTRQFGGSGLGLAISKHLVELMGGSIHIESVVGKGSRFWVDLPFDAASAPPLPERPVLRAVAGAGVRVLVAEDNPLNQQVIQGLLGHLGASVTMVGHGEAALTAFEAERFDLIFMDCQMPVMDGFEATRRIRAHERREPGRPAVHIVALTANALAGDRETCLAAGMSDYVTKPVTKAKLAAALARSRPEAGEAADADAGAALPQGTLLEAGAADFDPSVVATLPMVADGSDPEFAERMLTLFAQGTHMALDTIDQALRHADTALLLRSVHTLKSTAAQIGASALATEAARQEQLLRCGAPFPADGPVLLRRAFGRFELALAQHRHATRRSIAPENTSGQEFRHG